MFGECVWCLVFGGCVWCLVFGVWCLVDVFGENWRLVDAASPGVLLPPHSVSAPCVALDVEGQLREGGGRPAGRRGVLGAGRW